MSLQDGIVKWGIVGAGNISSDFVNAILCNLDPSRHEVVAVAARYKTILLTVLSCPLSCD